MKQEKRSEDESVCLLGIPDQKRFVPEDDPTISKLGGRPGWYSAPVVDITALACPSCAQQLFLVAQLYVPMTFDRTLYIFGCNGSECSEKSTSWRVFRDQRPVEEESKCDVVEQAEAETVGRDKINNGEKAAFGGDSDSEDSDDDWGDMGGDWGQSISRVGEDSSSKLESLLEKRDVVFMDPKRGDDQLCNAEKTISERQTKKLATDIPSCIEGNYFPSVYLDVIEEPYETDSRVKDFSYENTLYKEYLEREDKEKKARNNSTSFDAKKNTTMIEGGGEVTFCAAAEGYEKLPPKEKQLLKFQNRIKRSPDQCLRYQYEGTPLLPLPVDVPFIPPSCSCGEKRVFECQIMPGSTYVLKVDEIVRPTPHSENHSKEAKLKATGMDWGAVVVYSCPNSCSSSQEEYAYVQQAPK